MADADGHHPRAAELNESPGFHAGRISRCWAEVHKLIRTHLLFGLLSGPVGAQVVPVSLAALPVNGVCATG
jgi:hypothetical protein